MKKILLLMTILFMSVLTTACINNFAIQELNNKAKEYIDKGDTQTAVCRLRSILDLDDSVYEAHYNLAIAYISMENYDEAINELKKVMELKPDFYNAYYSYAVAKEDIAYKSVDTSNENITEEEAFKFNSLAQEAIDAYNDYLVKNVEAKDTEEINAKIAEINAKIKLYTERFDVSGQGTQEQTQTENAETANTSTEDMTE